MKLCTQDVYESIQLRTTPFKIVELYDLYKC